MKTAASLSGVLILAASNMITNLLAQHGYQLGTDQEVELQTWITSGLAGAAALYAWYQHNKVKQDAAHTINALTVDRNALASQANAANIQAGVVK